MGKGTAGSPETENGPLTLAAVTVILAPTAVNVPPWEALAVPSGIDPKLRVPGLTLNPAPVPESPAGDGVFEALLENDRVPEALPVATGAKSSEKLAVLPEVIVAGKGMPLSMKPAPLKVSVVTVTSPFVAVSVPVCNALLLPKLIFPKLKLAGEIDNCPAAREKFTPVLLALEIAIC